MARGIKATAQSSLASKAVCSHQSHRRGLQNERRW